MADKNTTHSPFWGGGKTEATLSRLLSVENLQTTFFTKAGDIRAVDGISYHIDKGETLGVVGESGCGKSVSSFSLLGLVSSPGKVTGGKVIYDGTDLIPLTTEQRRPYRGKRIAMIFQEPMTALNPVLSINYQISEQILAHEKVSKAECRDRSIELLSLVGIPAPEQRVDDYPHQLSGGMRQRAMIAMALSCNPELLICDEPTTALDVTIQAQILDLLQKLQEERKMSIQFITHDLGVISEIADRVNVMYAGTIVEKATSAQLFSAPKHPYTIGLLNSIPKIDVDQDVLPTIEGSVPSILDLPKGCRFQNRCPLVTEECRQVEPKLKDMGEGRQVACFNPQN
jgi:peptide/nickel transport system ATP-binding protein